MVVLHLLHPGASEPRRSHRGTPGCLRSRQSRGLTAGRAEPEALLPAVQGNLGGLSPELQPQGLHLWGGGVPTPWATLDPNCQPCGAGLAWD